jgi:hypothetical protein
MSDKAKPPTATMATPDMTWTLDLPERLRLTIADAVVIFSRIDNALIECIWVLEEADPRRKRQIAKARAFENIDYVKGVVVEHLKLDIDETWNALDQMRQERNLVAHGVWMMCFGGDGPDGRPVPPEGLPHVLWHSKMLEEGDYVVAEAFDFWRFDRFMKHAEVLLNTFRQFKTLAEDAIAAEKRSRIVEAPGNG